MTETRPPYGYFTYTAKPGDTLYALSKRFTVTPEEIKRTNPKVTSGHLKSGERLLIPSRLGGCKRGRFYAIKRRDTLYKIAKRNELTLLDLLEANPYLNPDYYVVGQIIVIPERAVAVKGQHRYTLKPGETIGSVLRKYDMNMKEFKGMNPGKDAFRLQPGDTISVRDPEIKRKDREDGFVYTMEDDENIASVAKKFGISTVALLKANPEVRPLEFTPGKRIYIPQKSG